METLKENQKKDILKIEKLFGYFNYTLELPTSGNPMLLTGPNGYGKTTILRILQALSNKDYCYFFFLPFDKIEFSTPKFSIFIESKTTSPKDVESEDLSTDETGPERTVTFSYRQNEGDDHQIVSPLSINNFKIYSALKNADFEEADFIEPKDILSYTEKIEEFLNKKSGTVNLYFRGNSDLRNLEIQLENIKVLFIPAQRILKFDIPREDRKMRLRLSPRYYRFSKDNKPDETITNIAQYMMQQLREAKFNYSNEVSRSNSDQFNRLYNATGKISENEYAEESQRITEHIKRLNEWQLCSEISFPQYDSAKQSLLKVYIETINSNLKTFEETEKKLLLFLSWLDECRFVNKKVSASTDHGLEVTDEKGHRIPIHKLSSGEKNEIILGFWLTFIVPDGIYLLIDEPENSLHLEWQVKFLPQMETICKKKNLNTIIATHSPYIINERWTQTVDLEDQLRKELAKQPD